MRKIAGIITLIALGTVTAGSPVICHANPKNPVYVIDITTESNTTEYEDVDDEDISEGEGADGTGNETLDKIIGGNDIDEITNDNGTVKKVDSQGFFNRIFRKTFEGMTFVQMLCCIILGIALIIFLAGLVLSWLGHTGKAMHWLVGILICLLAYVAVSYAPEMMIAFKSWFVTD